MANRFYQAWANRRRNPFKVLDNTLEKLELELRKLYYGLLELVTMLINKE